jgi:hypothetical protein
MTKHTDFSSESYSLTQEQLISILGNATTDVFDNELKYVRALFEPPFPEHECRKMKLPQLKYEVNIRGLMVVGTGKGGASKKIEYINALLGKQKPRKMVRTLD